jgi:hypothetical protein
MISGSLADGDADVDVDGDVLTEVVVEGPAEVTAGVEVDCCAIPALSPPVEHPAMVMRAAHARAVVGAHRRRRMFKIPPGCD